MIFKKGRNSKKLLSSIMVLAFLLTSLGNTAGVVFAQEIVTEVPTQGVTEEPTLEPTETVTPLPTSEPTEAPTLEPTELVTLTPEPTLEPTIIPTEIPDSSTNLILAAPEGWDAPIVISSQPGTHTTDGLKDGDDEYIDLAVFNDGAAVATSFNVCLKIDGEQVQCWEVASLEAGEFFTVEDWLYSANRGAGSHLFEIEVDADDTVAETDDGDNTWAFDFTWEPSDMAAQSVGSPLVNDAMPKPELPEMQEQSFNESSAPGYWDVANYMAGSVAVGVILPESAGSSENWTSAEQSTVASEIQTGINRWSAWSTQSAAGEFSNKDSVNANVTFTYQFHYSIPTSYEPIQMSSNDQCTWINEVMANMGYTNAGGCWYRVYDYLNDLRASKGTDWATLIFVVDSTADTDGMFTNGYFGYAYLHGPFIMLTYDNDGWGIAQMDRVVQHEMGHYFGAGDNYYQEGYGGCESTTEQYGYLGIPNSNCERNNSGAITDVLMNENIIDRNHWTAQYQVGWRDIDDDLIPDVMDTTPKFSMRSLDAYMNVLGYAYDDPYPKAASSSENVVTLNTITSAAYRIDAGDWVSIPAADGSFNSDYEQLSFSLGSVSIGNHTLGIKITNSIGNTFTTSQTFSYPLEKPTNDLITNANPMSLDTPYTSLTLGATHSSAADGATLVDPVNVCNSADTGSVWYQFTAPATGVYTLNAYGSDYHPNLTVVKKASTTSRPAVVCGSTDHYGSTSEEYYKLSFNGTSGATYLIGVSDNIGGGELSLKITQETCPSGNLCGAAVGGDGSVIRWPNMSIYKSNGNYAGSGYGEYSGFIYGAPYDGTTGSFSVSTEGDTSLIWNQTVTVPGYFTPSAVGYPKVLVSVKDTSGTLISTDSIAVVSATNGNLGGFLDGSAADSPAVFYMPAGTYSFFAASNPDKIEVYQPGIAVVSSSNPGSVVLDASALAYDTFTFNLDGITDSTAYIYSPDYYAHYMQLGSGGTVTFAAPLGTEIPFIDFEFYMDDTSGLTWVYSTGNDYAYISDGLDHEYFFGGALQVKPYVMNSPIRLDEGYGSVTPGITDGYYNTISNIYYNGFVSSAEPSANPSESAAVATEIETIDGTTFTRSIPGNDGGIAAQGYVYEPIYPTFTISDSLGGIVFDGDAESMNWFTQFEIEPSAPTGIWTVDESVDLGPFGGGLTTASTTFEVYSLAAHPLENDDFNSATVISSLPASIEGLDTRGGTQAADDPLIKALNSKGYASTWFKYVADTTGYLILDTFDSTYDTVLNVWQGSRGALTNRAYNDDFSGVTSKAEVPVTAGQTYYIEVTQYATQYSENLNVQSLKPSPSGDDITGQSIGGTLNLHASMKACYTLSATPNSTYYGSVSVSPAPNCMTNRYFENTEVTLNATAKPGYGFQNWIDATTTEPYTFAITGNTVLKANFVKMAAPVIVTPPQGALFPSHYPFITWRSVSNGATYEFQLDRQSTFTLPLDRSGTMDNEPEMTILPDLEDGTWYLRIRAITANGDPGPWTAVRSFTIDTTAPAAPVLYTPVNNSTPTGTPTFTWKATATAVRYRFGYKTDSTLPDSDPDPASFTYLSGELTTTSYKPPIMAVNTVFYWFVQARDAAGNWSEWSAPYQITSIPPTPAAVALNTPASGYLSSSSTPELTWKPTAYAVSYDMQVDNSIAFTYPLVQDYSNIDATAKVIDALDDGTYYWRVRAKNANFVYGPWSAYRSITIDTTAPAAPVLYTPADGATPTGTPTFTWKTATSAVRYKFAYSTSSDVLDETSYVYQSGELTTTYHKPPIMAVNTPYYWFVKAKDAAGNWSEWSTPFAVTSVPPTPAAVTLNTPASGFLTSNPAPELTWKPTAYAVSYDIQVDESYTFSVPLVANPTGITGTSHVLDTLADGKYYWRVRAVNDNGVNGAWSAYRYFTVDTTAPAAPILATPSDYGRPVGTPTFTWKAAATATRYKFAYSTSSDVLDETSYVYQSGELTTTYHKPPTMTLMTQYYWFVKAKDAAGNWSEWSTPFAVTSVPPKPATVTLLTPISGYLTSDTTPELTWKPASSAVSYNIQVDESYTFTAPLVAEYDGILVTSRTVDALPDGKYYWRVRAQNADGVYGPWSAYRYFTVDTTAPAAPVLYTPADDGRPVGTPTFTWKAAATASRYKFAYSTSSDVLDETSYVYQSGELTTTYHKPPTMTLMTQYYWFVKAKDAAGNWSEWSTPFAVTSVPPKPATVTLLTPASGYLTSDTTPELTWKPASSAVSYNIQVDESYTFTEPLVAEYSGILETYRSVDTMGDGKYFWRVRAQNADGVYGAWSAYRYFTVDTTAPVAPILATPADNGRPVGTPTFTWKAAATAVRYKFAYSTSSDVLDETSYVYQSGELTTTYHKPPTMGLMTQYYWFVKAKDTAGNWSDWSTPFAVTSVPPTPGTVTLNTPASGYLTNDTSPIVTWKPATYAVSYEVQVDDSSAFSVPLVQTYTGIGETSLVLDALTLDKVYYWRVRAKNANEVYGAWSAYRTFTIDTTAPAAPQLSSPANNAATTLSKPALTVLAVSGAAKYRFQIATEDTFTYPIRDFTQTGTSYTTPVALNYGIYFWRVQAIDKAGNISSWSSVRRFSVTLMKTPENGSVVYDSTPTFSWNALTGGLEYNFQVSIDPNFSSLVMDRLQTSVLSYTPTTEMENATYYWRVRVRTSAGWSAWLPTWSFTLSSPVLNGSFESGSSYWTEYSQHDWALVVSDYPHSGTYGAWLGGEYNDISYITQTDVSLNGARYLHFWYWTASSDYCGYDVAYAMVNGSIYKFYDLCSSTNTGGWRHQVIDLNDYRYSTISLKFYVSTDGSLNSNFFVDDISINSSSTAGSLPSAPATSATTIDPSTAMKKQ